MSRARDCARVMVWMVGVSAALTAASAPARAQANNDVASGPALSIGIGVGIGRGPTQTLTLGAGAVVDLPGPLRLKVELGRAVQGVGTTCEDAWPSSYACSARPLEVLAGPGITKLLGGRTALTAEVLGGLQRMDREECCGTAPALRLGGEMEARVRSESRWVMALGGYWLTAFNEAYRTLMGERPSYRILTVGVRYRVL